MISNITKEKIRVKKSTDLEVELIEGKTTNVHNAKEDKGEELISLNVKSKSGNEFINPLNTNPTKWSNTLKKFVGCCRVNTKCIENVLRYNNTANNRKIRKGRNKTYADVVSGRLE